MLLEVDEWRQWLQQLMHRHRCPGCLLLHHRAAAALLQEGSLDTRTYGKRLLWAVKLAVRGGGELDRLVAGACVCARVAAFAMVHAGI